MGRLREIWNNPKSLSILSLSWMLLWFLMCRFFIWPAFSLDLAEGAVVFVLAGQIPAIAVILRVRQLVIAARAAP
jgi:hypothetical protein